MPGMSGTFSMRKMGRWIGAGLTWAATAVAGDFTWTTNGEALVLAKYAGADAKVAIPAAVDGRPVAAIPSISPGFNEALSRASRTTGRIHSVCLRLAISGTTPIHSA